MESGDERSASRSARLASMKERTNRMLDMQTRREKGWKVQEVLKQLVEKEESGRKLNDREMEILKMAR
jgi:hypothetical protein